jgi:Protein of unknown function (DUF2442)/Putative addiction module component
MKTDKHGLKRSTRRTASAIPSAVLSEPKMTKAEKLEVERAWKIEVSRRMADFRAGKVKCVPAEQAIRNAYRAVNRVTQNRRQTKPLLINTGLQPGVSGRRVSLAVSTASRARGQAVKTAGTARVRQTTGLKSGVNETKYLRITDAEYVSGHKISLTFNDGLVRVMDFGPFLRKAMNPQTTKFRSLRKFKMFHLQHGDLMWGDYDMIFPIEDLYRGEI